MHQWWGHPLHHGICSSVKGTRSWLHWAGPSELTEIFLLSSLNSCGERDFKGLAWLDLLTKVNRFVLPYNIAGDNNHYRWVSSSHWHQLSQLQNYYKNCNSRYNLASCVRCYNIVFQVLNAFINKWNWTECRWLKFWILTIKCLLWALWSCSKLRPNITFMHLRVRNWL